MKTEDQTTSTQSTTSASTPTQAYPTQWASGSMAIDPILQQQSQSAQQHSTTTTAYQHYPYASHSHYPQAAYAAHYPYASPVTPQPTTTSQTQQTSSSSQQQQQTRQPAQYSTNTYNISTSANNNNGMDTADIATLNDALGSAGVDLRAEEESLQRSHDTHQSYRSYEDRTRKQPPKPSFDTRFIGPTMRTIGTQHKITRIPEESVNYLALALRARLQDLVTAMIAASHHRTDTQFDRPASFYEDGSPMWSIVVRSDVAKQLAALEKIEREEETRVRKERKERAEMTAAHAAALQAQANGMASGQAMDLSGAGGLDDSEGGAKKKRKKDGPGVTARNMSEDVRKKMSNAVATQAAGLGGKYSWMTAANASTPPPKAKPAVTTTAATPLATTTGTAPSAPTTTGVPTSPATTTAPAASSSGAGAAGAAGSSSWARPYVPTKKSSSAAPTLTSTEEDTRTSVTMRDAMFVVEKERGHGGGRGAARGWA